jgi:hypothetical protein
MQARITCHDGESLPIPAGTIGGKIQLMRTGAAGVRRYAGRIQLGIAAALIYTAQPSAARSKADAILARASSYVADFIQRFSSLVAQRFVQMRGGSGRDRAGTAARARARRAIGNNSPRPSRFNAHCSENREGGHTSSLPV